MQNPIPPTTCGTQKNTSLRKRKGSGQSTRSYEAEPFRSSEVWDHMIARLPSPSEKPGMTPGRPVLREEPGVRGVSDSNAKLILGLR